MSGRPIQKGSTDQSTIIRILDATDGTPEQGVEHNTAGIDLWYRREGGTRVAITEVALAALDTAHTDGGIEHIDDGYYRLDLPDAAWATGANGVMIGGAVTDMVVIGSYHPLVDYDPQDAVRLGLTALPNANADAAGGLPISDAGGFDVDSILTKMLAYFQLALRKDAAIATDNATELTAINADGGSGAGGYDNTTDSGEGIKDTGVASVAGAVGSVTGNVGGNVVGDVQGNVDGAVATATALGTQAKADVNAEVVDVIDTDTIAEPSQGIPPATPSLRVLLSWWWMDWRNAATATATQRTVSNNAGTVLAKATLSDDSTTFTKAEWVSGP